jgi:hypothetical protein
VSETLPLIIDERSDHQELMQETLGVTLKHGSSHEELESLCYVHLVVFQEVNGVGLATLDDGFVEETDRIATTYFLVEDILL